MRLRLRIERNELPPTKVVHSIPPTQLSQTVSQFLQSVNALFPLESTTWDISDYAVLIDGYEATHYTEVGQAFKDEDEVVIKPLGFAELRARTLTGRDQISEDGRHLLDGIPFGRPMLKRPRRPEVKIPPRKKQKTESVGDKQVVVRHEGEQEGDDEVDEDDEDDEDFEYAEADEDSEKEVDEEDSEKVVDEDSSDSDSSEDESDSSDSDSSREDSSESESESESASGSEASWDGVEEQVTIITESASATVPPKPAIAKAAPKPQGLPHQGDARTKERNNRRRDSRKLKHLKEAGALPQHATLQDMHNWQQSQCLDDDGVKAAAQKARMEKERKRLLGQIASGGIDVADIQGTVEEDEDGPPEEVSSKPNGTLPGATGAELSDAASTQITTEIEEAAAAGADEAQLAQGSETDSSQAPASKRARLDTKSMNRLVFGSLGLRTPKTQEDRHALQKKLAARLMHPGAATVSDELPAESTVEEDEDPEAWREKIVLTAVECVDEDVTLSEPPFPFQQRWDPQYQLSKKRKKSRGRKSDAQPNGAFIETYDKYNQDGGGDGLNYDDPDDGEEVDDSYWEEGALLKNGDEADEEVDLFSKLPDNISALPALAATDARTGDFITYQELSVSAATSWEPKIVTHVAHIEAINEDGSWRILLRQDRPKQYDEAGNRVYRKFEMENFSDDGNEDDAKTVTFDELQDIRLLQRPISENVAS